MDKKLTLSLDQEVIEQAKEYAKASGTSVSRLVEAYLDRLTQPHSDERPLSRRTVVDELFGIIDLPDGFDEKQAYREYLAKKYC